MISQTKQTRRRAQIATGALIAAFSGWLAMDYLGEAPLPGIADAAVVPVVSALAAPAPVSAPHAVMPAVDRKPIRRIVKARTQVHDESPDGHSEVPTCHSTSAPTTASETPLMATATPQPLAGMLPPVAMLMAACALQQQLLAAVQIR